LVAANGDSWELYNLQNDRAEQNNLAAKLPDKVTELERTWQKQTERYTELARKTLAEQRQRAAKSKKSNQ
jgi:arylsulfatase